MGERVKDKIEYEVMVTKLDCVNRKVNDKYQADVIINSVPWTEFEEITGCPDEVKSCCAKLPYTSLEVRHFTEDTPNDYQWVYYPDLSLPYHRKFFRANYLEGSHGGYYETNMERVPLYEQADIRQESAESNHKEAVAGFGRIAPTGWKYINKYAYPCNTIRKPAMIKNILGYMASQKIYGVGRWGEWEHLNADVVVQHVKELLKG